MASRAMTAARAVLAVSLLLTLIAGSIALPAAASGPMCSMACCAGRAPHAAGSCMEGSCHSGAATPKPASGSGHQSHEHHEQQPPQEPDPSTPQAFAGAVASAGGSDMGEVPTVEAAPYEANTHESSQADEQHAQHRRPAISATVLSKPCQADCGVSASSFGSPKRPRNAAVLAGHNQLRSPSSVKLARYQLSLTPARSAFSRHRVPRGPPALVLLLA